MGDSRRRHHYHHIFFQVLIAGTPTRRKNIIDLLVEIHIIELPTEIYQSKPLKDIITLIIIMYYYISFINISHCDFLSVRWKSQPVMNMADNTSTKRLKKFKSRPALGTCK